MSTSLEISCPRCGKLLKLPDRSLLGKKGRCGKCQHKFILEEPKGALSDGAVPVFKSLDDEPPKPPVEFELVMAPRGIPEQPLLGVAARWVPDTEGPLFPAPAPGAGPAFPDEPSFPAPGPNGSPPANDLNFGLIDAATDGSRSPTYSRKRSSRRLPIILTAIAIFGLGGGAAWYLATRPAGKAESVARSGGKRSEATTGGPRKAPPGSATADEPDVGPTHGKPLTLAMVPMGARLLIHLRPAELWESGGAAEEFRACLGPLGKWVEEQLRSETLLEPVQIDSVLCALIPVSRDEFDTAFVIHTKGDIKRSALIDKFGGELIDNPKPHYRNDRRLLWIVDARTIVFAPREMADSVFESAGGDSLTSEGIQALLSRTDRDRHFTLMCEMEDLRNGAEKLVPASLQNLLQGAIDFAGEDVETLVWSLHLGDPDRERNVYSEMLVRNRSSHSAASLQRELREKLEKFPMEMLELVYRTNPRQLGERKIVGRFPIMTKVIEQSTRFETSGRLVAMRWSLPERAASNLALGTLLTWNQTTLPEFGKQPAPRSSAPDASLPKTIAERLQKRIDAEFRDDFLYVALNYISEETGVQFKLDGPGMKRVGATQNEKQKLNVQDTPAVTILDQMLTPKKLVLIVDEQRKTATVTSIDAAEDQKLSIFPLKAGSGK